MKHQSSPLPDNVKPAKTVFPGATHEIVVAALDPARVPDLTVDTSQYLHSLNFAGQWQVPERPNPVDLDRGAAAKIRFVVDEIIRGVLSPDTDFRREWIKRFSDSNVQG